jgi:ribosomal protein S18 acetylase RimI-like enzyme
MSDHAGASVPDQGEWMSDRTSLIANVDIRQCKAGDASALSLIGQSTFLETFAGILRGPDIVAHCARAHAAERYAGWLADPAYRLWLAETAGGAPVGFVLAGPADLPLADLSGSDCELKRIYLLSRFHGGGVGKRLVAEAEAYARERAGTRLLLGVYANNHAAIGFYERCGFVRLGKRRFDVGGALYDDVIMGKPA